LWLILTKLVNVKDGKGALNYLSNDPKLVHQIDSTMTNVNESSEIERKFRRNIIFSFEDTLED
jgi:hypothetical protein